MATSRCLWVLLLLGPVATGQERFLGQQLDTPYENPSAPVVGDFDGDGQLDVVSTVATETYWILRLQPGDGLGWVKPAQDEPLAPLFANAYLTADMDADGDMDLVSRDQWNAAVTLNDGMGHFATDGIFHFVAGDWGSMVQSDLNQDGHADVVALHRFPGAASVLLGNGQGGFQPASPVTTDDDLDDCAVGDVTLDGWPDLVLPDPDKLDFRVLPGNAQGGFGWPEAMDAGFKTRTVALGDVNGDGALDVVAGRIDSPYGGYLSVNDNNGSGWFVEPLILIQDSNVQDIALVDLNLDGLDDIVTANWGSVPGVSILLSAAGGSAFTLAEHQVTGHNPQAVRVADFDADGEADVFCNGLGLSLFHGAEGGTFVQPPEVESHGAMVHHLLIADVTGDGAADVVAASSPGSPSLEGFATLYAGDGRGGLAAGLELPAGGGPLCSTSADFDEDGRPDIVVANESTHDLSLLMTDGSTWTNVMAGGWPWFEWNQQPLSVTAGDFDSDGHQDLLAAKYKSHEISVVLSAGAGAFKSPLELDTGSVSGPVQALAGDLDEDGDLDAVYGDAAAGGKVVALLNDGTGVLSEANEVLTPVWGYLSLAADDLDLDGHLDVVTGGGHVLFGDGAGQLVPRLPAPIYSSGVTVATADIDGDNLPEVIWTDSSGRILVWRVDDTGTLTASMAVVSSSTGRACAVGDLDGDGLPDLLGAGNEPRLTIHINQAASAFWTDLGGALAGAAGSPSLQGYGATLPGSPLKLMVAHGPANGSLALVLGLDLIAAPFKGGVLLPHPDAILGGLPLDAAGSLTLAGAWPAGIPGGTHIHLQGWMADATGPQGFSATNGLTATTP